MILDTINTIEILNNSYIITAVYNPSKTVVFIVDVDVTIDTIDFDMGDGGYTSTDVSLIDMNVNSNGELIIEADNAVSYYIDNYGNLLINE